MFIFVDPTELGPGSRLPGNVAAVAKPLPQLEAMTGADLLLSPLPIPATSEPLLRRHCQAGLLVQLKRWGDLQSAITTEQRLFREIFAMRDWTPRPWLIVTGMLFEHEGKAVVGELESTTALGNSMIKAAVVGRQGLDYAAVDAALNAWAYYGGYIEFAPHNGLVLPWLERQFKALNDIAAGKVTHLQPRGFQRQLEGPTRITWLAALLDGVGEKTAQAIFDKLQTFGIPEPTLYDALAFATTYAATEVPGITTERVSNWRMLLGLDHFEIKAADLPATYSTLGISYRLRETGEVYWRAPYCERFHYRNRGMIETDAVFTVATLRNLLGSPWVVVYTEGNRKQRVNGLLQGIAIDAHYEWLEVITLDGTLARVRLDWIDDLEKGV